MRELYVEASHHQTHHISQLTIGQLSSHTVVRAIRERDECRGVVDVRPELPESWGDRTRGFEPAFWEERLWLGRKVAWIAMERVWRDKDFRFFGYNAKLRAHPSASESGPTVPRDAYLPAIILGPYPRGILLDPLVGTEGMTL